MLLDDIRKDMQLAKKEKDSVKANLLSTLYSEIFTASKRGKEMTEEDSVRIVKKFIKNIDETLALYIPEASREKYLAEKAILENYLPKQLTSDEIEEVVSELLSEGKEMKEIMIHFKENFAGRYDGRIVNEAVRSKLQKS
jgi:CRISPR-associated protein Cas8b1/Cst1 subtype I-B